LWLLFLSIRYKFAKETANSEDVRFGVGSDFYGAVIASYVALHAFCAAVEGAAANEVNLRRTNALAFEVVFFAACRAVTYEVIFAVAGTAVHNASLWVQLRLDEGVQGRSEVYDSADWAEFVAPEPPFF
jgi:hypothetical protein